MDPTEESLSALSTQLVSLGYLSRPLDLATLFLAPSLPAGASSKHARKHHDLLILQARAREQIAKCLWGMLEQRQTERDTIETLLAREARANEEAERERKAADRARKEREAMGREVEAEKARAKEAEQKLRNEQDRHRHARDELAKTKNALQFVKTQALHDQKRRESEVQSLHQRLQKLTTAPASSTSSESAFTRFTILNGTSPTSSPVTATITAVTQTGRSASRTASRVPTTHTAVPSAAAAASATALDAAELELVRTTLDERISACSHLERENRQLRTFVGEVGEWAEGVLEIEELASVRKDREEGGEMREVLNDGDESYLIPAPHLALPVAALTSPLHRKLYAIRLGVSSLSEQSAATLASVRDELEGEIERLHEEVEEEVVRREEVEKERETALEAVRKGEQLVEEWAQKAQAERRRRLTGLAASDDESPVTAQGSGDIADKRRRERAPATERSAAAAAPTSRAARPSAPSAHVADFLADLGLDTPAAAEKEKAPLRTTKADEKSQKQTISSSSHRGKEEEEERPTSRAARDDGRSDRRRRDVDSRKEEVDGDMLPPPPATTRHKTTTSSLPSSSRSISTASSSRASTVSGSTTCASTTSSSLSRSSRRQEQEAPSAAATGPAAAGHPSSTLQDILALADSPPVTSEPLMSAAATKASRTSRDRPAEPRQVLVASSSRVVNALATTGASDKTEELGDRVAAKKQALLARARSPSSRKVAPE